MRAPDGIIFTDDSSEQANGNQQQAPSEPTIAVRSSTTITLPRPTPLTPAQRKHLETERDELQKRYQTLTRRIEALDTDIGRELDSERKLVFQERRSDLAADRDQVLSELTGIERQLGGTQGAVAQAGTGGDSREARDEKAAPELSFTTDAEPAQSNQRGSVRQGPPQRDAIEPVSADLQLLVTLAPDGKTLSYTLNSPAGDYNFLQLGSMTLQVSPREVLQRTFDRLNTLAHLSPEKRTPAQTQQAVRELADIGSNLYDELLPDAFKEEYRALREKYLGCNLWLTSNEP